MKQTSRSADRSPKKAPASKRSPAPPSTFVDIDGQGWTILETAESSLARILSLPPPDASSAVKELAGDMRPTGKPANQAGQEIWRASSRWHRLRALVERVSPTELKLCDVLAHADWQPPTGTPPPAPPAVPRPPVRPPPIPLEIVARPPPAPPVVRAPPEPAVLVVRRPPVRAILGDDDAAPAGPAAVSVASALSTSQLLALHAVLADWRRGGIWPGLTKLAAVTELPRSQVAALAAEIERLSPNRRPPGGAPSPEPPLLAQVRARIQKAVQLALRPLPATTWRELRIDVDMLAERLFVVTVSAGFDTTDAVIEGLTAAKAEGITRLPRGVQAVIRA